jgi:DNA-binding Xre family transcriptional regulator
MEHNKNTHGKLYGLFHIVNHLGIHMASLSEQSGIEKTYLSKIANLHNGCSLRNLGILSQVLCCEPGDLMAVPTDVRLAQIKLGYLIKQVEQQRAHVVRLELRQQEEVA